MTKLSQNLVATSKEVFTGDILTRAGIYLDESENSIYIAVTAAIPIVFSGLLLKADATGGTAVVHELATELADHKLSKHITTLIGDGTADIMRDTSLIISRVFDKYPGSMIQAIVQVSRVSPYTASVLLSMVTPVVLSVIGKHISAKKSTVAATRSLLQAQRVYVELAMPPAIDINTIFSNVVKTAADTQKRKRISTKLTLKVAGVLLILVLAGIAGVACFKHKFDETDKKDIRTEVNKDTSNTR